MADKIPNSKLQIPNKSKISNLKSQIFCYVVVRRKIQDF